MEEKLRIYSGKKYYNENASKGGKNGVWSYSYKYSGQKTFWARTEESPEDYNNRMNPKKNIENIVTISYKGKIYNEEDLDVLSEILLENYVPKNNHSDDILFDQNEELSEEQLKEITNWKIKLKASAWKSRQRSLRKKDKLDQYKIDSLNKLGMVWNPKDDEWEKSYLLYRKTGLCDEIESWVKEQRVLYNDNEISNENLYRLKAFNFPFKPKKNEDFPFTFNTIYVLQEKLRKKKRRIELKLINNPPKRLNEIQKKIIKKEKQDINRREAHKSTNSFYTKLHMINGRVEKDLVKLNYHEIKNTIKQIESGISIYYDAKKEYLDNVVTNKVLGHYTKSYVNTFYDDININITPIQKFYQISIFNSTKFDNEIRIYTCKILLNYFELVIDIKLKNFKPLDFLISHNKKEKNVDELLKLKKFINKYPLLSELYNHKIEKVLIKL